MANRFQCDVCGEVQEPLVMGATTEPDCASCGHRQALHVTSLSGNTFCHEARCSCDHYSTHEPPDPTEPMRTDIQTLVGALNYARESALYFLDSNQPEEVRRYLTEIERIARSIQALSKRI